MATVLCVLYDDPVDGYPTTYARDDIPTIERYHDGMSTPTPEGIDFTPGALLGSVSGELGLRKFLENLGHTLIVTADKDFLRWDVDRRLPCYLYNADESPIPDGSYPVSVAVGPRRRSRLGVERQEEKGANPFC